MFHAQVCVCVCVYGVHAACVRASPMALMALHSSLVKWERGTSVVMGTTATVARLDVMCFLMSVEPEYLEKVIFKISTVGSHSTTVQQW